MRRTITPSPNHESETSESEEKLLNPFDLCTFGRELSFEELVWEIQKLTSDKLENKQKDKVKWLFKHALGHKDTPIDMMFDMICNEIDGIFIPIKNKKFKLHTIGRKLTSWKGNSKGKIVQEDEHNKALIMSLKDQLYKQQERILNLEEKLKSINKENLMVKENIESINEEKLNLQKHLNSINEQNERYKHRLKVTEWRLEDLANAYFFLY